MTDLRSSLPRFNSTTLAAISLVVVLLGQTVGIVWWGAHIDQRMTVVEQKVAAAADTGVLIARLDERTASLVTTVNRIDQRQNAQDDARLANRK